MLTVLWILLFIILLAVGKKQGVKTFFTFLLSLILIVIYIILMSWGINAILLAFLICIASSYMLLFMLNGKNKKTISAFISVIIVLLALFLIIFIVDKRLI